jgi:hypothetical protein
LVSFAFKVTGEHPALLRSLLTSATMRDTLPEAGAAVDGAVDGEGEGAVGLGATGLGAEGLGAAGFDVVGFGAEGLGAVGLGAAGFRVLGVVVGVCDPGVAGLRSHLPPSHRRSDSSASHRWSEYALFHLSWERLPWLPCPSIQAMATEGTPTAAMATAAMVIFR